jgi:hypothetical protein
MITSCTENTVIATMTRTTPRRFSCIGLNSQLWRRWTLTLNMPMRLNLEHKVVGSASLLLSLTSGGDHLQSRKVTPNQRDG